jgi:DNA-binding response OmpR family regulator
MNALIIHRQHSFSQMVKEKFSLGGWRVRLTDNGLDGLLTARHHRFDLILCGFDLPVVSGTEVVRSIRMLSLNRYTPVFFLSNGSAAEWQKDFAWKLEAHILVEGEIEKSEKVAWLSN